MRAPRSLHTLPPAHNATTCDVVLHIPPRRFALRLVAIGVVLLSAVPLRVAAQTVTAVGASSVPAESAPTDAETAQETSDAEMAQGISAVDIAQTLPGTSGIDAEFLTRQLEDDVDLAVSRSEASRLREEGSQVSQRLAAMRGDVDVLSNRIAELEFAMQNQVLLVDQARTVQRDMAVQRSEILAELQLLELEENTLEYLMIQRAISTYMNPTSEADISVLTAESALDVEHTRELVRTVLEQESGVIDALEQRSTAMAENEQILQSLADHADRTHHAETRAQESLARDQNEYVELKALLGEQISLSEVEYTTLATLADEVDAEIALREAELHAIAVRRAERRSECEASGGQVADDGTDIDCSYLGATLAPGSLAPPLFSTVSSGFGMRSHPIDGVNRMHEGWDYDASTGTAIGAAGPGEVFFVGSLTGFGKTVIIDHGGGVETLYAHQSEIIVTEGTVVATGQTIGMVGSTGKSTGPHLHFEVSVNGSPVDPAGYVVS